jgi:hypothetical protein
MVVNGTQTELFAGCVGTGTGGAATIVVNLRNVEYTLEQPVKYALTRQK